MEDSLNNAVRTCDLGLGLPPGAAHYRAYVGPPEDYDLISAMVFNLLTCAGLRQHHRVLDIGCGSLRIGRLLIPYLNPGNYFGIEPNQWLVSDGILNEVGQDQISLKRPTFSYCNSLREFNNQPLEIDFAVAQSIFSHCSTALIREWLNETSQHLKDNGALFATFLVAEEDYCGTEGWIYPGCVKFRPQTMAQLAIEAGLEFTMLDWKHPRQTWAIFSKPGFNDALVSGGNISWNRMMGTHRP